MRISKAEWLRRRRVYYRTYRENPVNRLAGLFHKAVLRAKAKGMPVDRRVLHLLRTSPPKRCACCKHKLDYSVIPGAPSSCSRRRRQFVPSLDRRNNKKGYTLGNTFVVCMRCNSIKSDASVKEIQDILRYMS